jgi:hypothetical protein
VIISSQLSNETLIVWMILKYAAEFDNNFDLVSTAILRETKQDGDN